jgi:hypothetical protein
MVRTMRSNAQYVTRSEPANGGDTFNPPTRDPLDQLQATAHAKLASQPQIRVPDDLRGHVPQTIAFRGACTLQIAQKQIDAGEPIADPDVVRMATSIANRWPRTASTRRTQRDHGEQMPPRRWVKSLDRTCRSIPPITETGNLLC